MTRWTALLIMAGLILAGCASTTEPGAPTADPAGFVRRLATVDLPPTPDDADWAATRAAARPSPTFLAPTLAITPTIYVGTFLGVEQDDPALPVVDPALFQGSPGAPTLVAPDLTACAIPAEAAFGEAWQVGPGVREGLGCPTEAAVSAQGASLVFERGLMLFLAAGDIWAIQPGGAYWHTPQAPAEPPWDQPAPEGLRVPALGFGAYWKATPVVREALGFARADESGGPLLLQRFDGGVLLRDGATGATFALVGEADTGVTYGPY